MSELILSKINIVTSAASGLLIIDIYIYIYNIKIAFRYGKSLKFTSQRYMVNPVELIKVLRQQ